MTRAAEGPTYNADYLSQLKASTPGSRPKTADDDSAIIIDDVTRVASAVSSALATEVVDLTGMRSLSVYDHVLLSLSRRCRYGNTFGLYGESCEREA